MNHQLKKISIVAVLVINLLLILDSYAEDAKDFYLFQLSKYKNPSLDHKFYGFSLSYYDDLDRYNYLLDFDYRFVFSIEKCFSNKNKSIGLFYLKTEKIPIFALELSPYLSMSRKKKNYTKTALEIGGLNLGLWAYSRYYMKEGWAIVSLNTIIKNFKDGPTWDRDPFVVNHFRHPYHGAIHYATARANRFNFYESTLWSFLGGFMWEFILESRGYNNNPPSANDLIMNPLGGAPLGEVLFRISGLILDESSVGSERVLRESLALLINPANGFRFLSGKAFKRGNPPEKHYYHLNFPIGAYGSSVNETYFLVAANGEYQDYLKSELSKINPYDWFVFDTRLGFHDKHNYDVEIYTLGILDGKRHKNGLAGLFGVFDYIESHTADQINAIGVGPGMVTIFGSNSDVFFSSYGVLSLILGASSPSFDLKDYRFGTRDKKPYYFGPGTLGKIKLEFGKRGLGSIQTTLSHYWVHSLYTRGNEFLTILNLNIKYDLSTWSQIGLGYDYYLRHGELQSQSLIRGKKTVHALYIFKF